MGRALDPAAPVQDGIFLGNAAHQHDDLCQYQLGHAAGIGKRGIEDRNTQARGGLQIDLVGANAKATNGSELRRRFKYCSRQLGA